MKQDAYDPVVRLLSDGRRLFRHDGEIVTSEPLPNHIILCEPHSYLQRRDVKKTLWRYSREKGDYILSFVKTASRSIHFKILSEDSGQRVYSRSARDSVNMESSELTHLEGSTVSHPVMVGDPSLCHIGTRREC